MDTNGIGKTAKREPDPLKSWLDGCYRKWKKEHMWLLVITALIVWIPTAIQEVRHLRFISTGAAQFAYLGSLSIWFENNGFIFILPIALVMVAAIGTSFWFPPELLLTTSREQAFLALRSRIRGSSLKWMLGWMLIPSLFAYMYWPVQWAIPSSVPHWFNPSFTEWFVLCLFLFSLQSWFSMELCQYVNLLFIDRTTIMRVLTVLLFCLPYVVVLLFWNPLLNYFPSESSRLTLGFKMLPCAGIPFVSALYMMFATRKPTKAMLERL